MFIPSPQTPLCFFNYRYLHALSPYTLLCHNVLFFPHPLLSPSLSTLLLPSFHPPSSAPLIPHFPFSLQLLNNAYRLTPILYPLSSILTTRHNFFSPRSFKITSFFPFQLIHSPSLLQPYYSINLYLNVGPFLYFTLTPVPVPNTSFFLPSSLLLHPVPVFSKLAPNPRPS